MYWIYSASCESPGVKLLSDWKRIQEVPDGWVVDGSLEWHTWALQREFWVCRSFTYHCMNEDQNGRLKKMLFHKAGAWFHKWNLSRFCNFSKSISPNARCICGDVFQLPQHCLKKKKKKIFILSASSRWRMSYSRIKNILNIYKFVKVEYITQTSFIYE